MLNRLILGTAQIGLNYGINNSSGKPSHHEALSLLELAHQNGIFQLDSSAGYGTAHQVIRESLATGNHFHIFSKFTCENNRSFKDLISKIFIELDVKSIHGLSFHRFSDLETFAEWDTVLSLKKEKKILQFGASVYSEDELEACIQLSEIDLIQIPLNLLDHSGRKIELIRKAHSMGKVIHVRSIFLQGLLFRSPDQLPPGLEKLASHLEQLDFISKKSKIDLSEMALIFPFLFPEIKGVLLGVETQEQLRKNLNILKTCNIESQPWSDIKEEILSLTTPEPELINPVLWPKS